MSKQCNIIFVFCIFYIFRFKSKRARPYTISKKTNSITSNHDPSHSSCGTLCSKGTAKKQKNLHCSVDDGSCHGLHLQPSLPPHSTLHTLRHDIPPPPISNPLRISMLWRTPSCIPTRACHVHALACKVPDTHFGLFRLRRNLGMWR